MGLIAAVLSVHVELATLCCSRRIAISQTVSCMKFHSAQRYCDKIGPPTRRTYAAATLLFTTHLPLLLIQPESWLLEIYLSACSFTTAGIMTGNNVE